MKRIFILTFVLWMIVMIAVIMHILVWFVWYYHSSRTVLVIILTYHSSILKFETSFAAASAYLSFFFIIPFFLFATSLIHSYVQTYILFFHPFLRTCVIPLFDFLYIWIREYFDFTSHIQRFYFEDQIVNLVRVFLLFFTSWFFLFLWISHL